MISLTTIEGCYQYGGSNAATAVIGSTPQLISVPFGFKAVNFQSDVDIVVEVSTDSESAPQNPRLGSYSIKAGAFDMIVTDEKNVKLAVNGRTAAANLTWAFIK